MPASSKRTVGKSKQPLAPTSLVHSNKEAVVLYFSCWFLRASKNQLLCKGVRHLSSVCRNRWHGLNCVDITEKVFLVWLSLFTLFIFFLSLVPGTIVRTLAKVYTSQLLYVIVAQLIEHLTFNQRVVGLSPISHTTINQSNERRNSYNGSWFLWKWNKCWRWVCIYWAKL